MNSHPTAVVTGVTKGLGRELALSLVERGYRVLGVGRSAEGLDSLGDEIPTADQFVPVRADLATSDGLETCIRALKDAIDGQLNVLVNNAALQYFAPVDRLDPALFRETLIVNTFVPFALSQALLPELTATRGIIINIASDLAYRPMTNGSAYVASKFGLFGMSQVFQDEVRDRGVRVSVVEPGFIATGENAHIRAAAKHMSPAELARVVLWVLDSPDGVRVDRLTVHPMMQGSWGDISLPS
jgi:NAD(P)-dependent dehydrogenase (short-subunit alcohol dehydrogenase family)